jgi:hypothetical protein
MNPQLETLLAAVRLKILRDTFRPLVKDGSDREIGRKVLLLAYCLDPAAIGTQRELARRLGVTEGRSSQMLKVIRRSFKR